MNLHSDRIWIHIRQIEAYLEELYQVFPLSSEEYCRSFMVKRTTERLIQIIIESMMDTAALLCREINGGIPGDEENILDKLSGRCLSPEIVATLKQMKGFRNILVHGYLQLDDDLVFENVETGIEDIRRFCEEVIRYMESEDRNPHAP